MFFSDTQNDTKWADLSILFIELVEEDDVFVQHMYIYVYEICT